MFDSSSYAASADDAPALKTVDLKTLKAIYSKSQVKQPASSPPPSAPPTPRPAQELKLEDFATDSLSDLPLSFALPESDMEQRASSLIVLSESMMQTATPRHAHQAVSMPLSLIHI